MHISIRLISFPLCVGYRNILCCQLASSDPVWLTPLLSQILHCFALSLTVTEVAFLVKSAILIFFTKFGIVEIFCSLTLLTIVIPNFGPFGSIFYHYRDSIFGQFGHFDFFHKILNFCYMTLQILVISNFGPFRYFSYVTEIGFWSSRPF